MRELNEDALFSMMIFQSEENIGKDLKELYYQGRDLERSVFSCMDKSEVKALSAAFKKAKKETNELCALVALMVTVDKISKAKFYDAMLEKQGGAKL